MLFQKNKFQKRTIGATANYGSYRDIVKPARKWSPLKIFLVVVCVCLVLLMSKYIIIGVQAAIGQIAKWTVNVVSNSMGEDMKQDEFGNVNVLMVWYGGEWHAGSFLADSIMVASFNPKLGAVTMLSVPRDLYVYDTGWGIVWRINEVFSVGVGSKREYGSGAQLLTDMVQKVMGITIPYYALVDFGWFKEVVDTLGGITIDVPEAFSDSTYPTANNGYMTVTFASWIQNMDGEKALQYARSRHTTSDFARSLRQQTIVKAIIDKAMSQGLGTLSKIKKLYGNYTAMVKTNVSIQEIMWLAKYMYDLKHIFSYGYTTECSNLTFKYSYPGCFLYTPDRDLFGGASIMIPDGAAPGNVWFYVHTEKFASYVLHNQEYLIEGLHISVMNWVDKTYARQTIGKSEWFAMQLAVKLKKFALDIVDVRNFGQVLSGTTVYVLGTWKTDQTIKTLKTFLPITNVEKDSGLLWFENLTGVDMVLVLGNDYVNSLVQKPFSYYQ